MQIRELFEDDDAVSPVIGVILMVAITVILAAVIGAFVLGFGAGGPSAPNTNWDTSQTADSNGTTVQFTLQQSSADLENGTLSASGDAEINFDGGSYPVTAGDTLEVPDIDNNTDSVSIAWESEGTSSTLATHEIE